MSTNCLEIELANLAILQRRANIGSIFLMYNIFLGAVHILRNTLLGGGGLPDLLQYYIGGFFKVYYNTDFVY